MSAIKERPTKKQLGRRQRAAYPSLFPGEQATVQREECGNNRYLAVNPTTGQLQGYWLRKAFIRFREVPSGSRSKYLPAPRAAKNSKLFAPQ